MINPTGVTSVRHDFHLAHGFQFAHYHPGDYHNEDKGKCSSAHSLFGEPKIV